MRAAVVRMLNIVASHATRQNKYAEQLQQLAESVTGHLGTAASGASAVLPVCEERCRLAECSGALDLSEFGTATCSNNSSHTFRRCCWSMAVIGSESRDQARTDALEGVPAVMQSPLWPSTRALVAEAVPVCQFVAGKAAPCEGSACEGSAGGALPAQWSLACPHTAVPMVDEYDQLCQ